MMTLLLSVLAFYSILHASVACFPDPVDRGCWAQNFFIPSGVVLRCLKLGIDGRTFEQTIDEESIPYRTFGSRYSVNDTKPPTSEWYFQNVSISEIADLVQLIVFQDSVNVTMGENSLVRFVNLTHLNIWGPSGGEGERGRLNLAPGALRQAPQLHKMEITRMTISDESMRVLFEMKDRLSTISIGDVSPEDTMLTSLGQFSLKSVTYFHCTTTRLFPIEVIRNLSATLNTFHIENCHFPKLTKDMFATCTNLTSLQLMRVNLIEVEAGALDQNLELEVVNLRDNKDLTTLPDGLFSKLKKLRLVNLKRNPSLTSSVDRLNFTHVQDLRSFRLILQ